jgi:hypothetical protein
MLDPRLTPLCDALVELVVADVVRELQTKNAVAPTRETDGVKDKSGKSNTPRTAPPA